MCFHYYSKGSIDLTYEAYVEDKENTDEDKLIKEDINYLVNAEKKMEKWVLTANSNQVAEQPQPGTGELL